MILIAVAVFGAVQPLQHTDPYKAWISRWEMDVDYMTHMQLDPGPGLPMHEDLSQLELKLKQRLEAQQRTLRVIEKILCALGDTNQCKVQI